MKRRKSPGEQARPRRSDNKEVGRRARARRLACHLSQTALADKLGLTFQQVQKYETGASRIGIGRLQRISEALEVPTAFFFDMSSGSEARAAGAPSKDPEIAFSYMQTVESLRIVKAFHKIKSRKAQQLLVEMAEELAEPSRDITHSAKARTANRVRHQE